MKNGLVKESELHCVEIGGTLYVGSRRECGKAVYSIYKATGHIIPIYNYNDKKTIEMKNFEWIYVHVYRWGDDCTNNGISSRHDTLTCFRGDLKKIKAYVDENNIDLDKCLYVVNHTMLWGEKSPYLTPLEWALNKPTDGPVMMGGNYAKGDSRWHEWFGHYLPLPIHDRKETWKEYEEMSI